MAGHEISEVPSIEIEPEEITKLRAAVQLQTTEVIKMGAELRARLIIEHVAAGVDVTTAAILVALLVPLVGESKKH